MTKEASALMMLLLLLVVDVGLCYGGGGVTSRYIRRLEASVDMPMDADVFREPPGFNSPQQVHITQGDLTGTALIISWVTPALPGSNDVFYGVESGKYSHRASGTVISYKYFNYTSGYIHHCTLQNLQYNTKYYYKIGEGRFAREFSFVTPPEVGADVPQTFGIIGDLGQTYDSNKTLHHYLKSKGQAVLFVGDLSYADKYPYYDNRRWDTWSRFVERSNAYQPWIWATGNHDIEYGPEFGEVEIYTSFNHRFKTPYRSSNSTSSLWYSIQRGSAYIIVLSSYSGFVKYSPQYRWFLAELEKVDRTKTPWLIIIMHVALYNSNSVHYMEGEAMRSVLEEFLVKYKVDVVFSGHVHAYERTYRVSNILFNLTNGICTPTLNENAPVYIVVGDGGNVEGLAIPYTEPQPAYSAFREASFGHAILEIKNRTHAHYYWHRNQDGDAVLSDSYWFRNRYWKENKSGLDIS